MHDGPDHIHLSSIAFLNLQHIHPQAFNNRRGAWPAALAEPPGLVVNGADLKLTLRPQGGYLAFLGRIAPEKGPETAIQIARSARSDVR